MKELLKVRFTIFNAFVLVAAMFLGSKVVVAETQIVPDQYATIQEAINHAQTGDTVLVRAGIYYERVILNKSGVSLVGEPGATIRDDSPAPLPPVLNIGPSFPGPLYAPRPVEFVEGAEVRGLRIESSFANVMGIFGVKNLHVSGVTIVQAQLTGVGIHSWNEGVEIDHCTFIGSGIGVGINLAPYGLFFQNGQEPAYNHDLLLHNNKFSGLDTGISLINVRGGYVGSNISVGNPSGIELNGVIDVTVVLNQFKGAARRGIGIRNTTGSIVAGNLLVDDSVGLEFLTTNAFFVGKGYPATDQNYFLYNVFHNNGVDISVLEPIPVGPGHNVFSKNFTDQEPALNIGN